MPRESRTEYRHLRLPDQRTGARLSQPLRLLLVEDSEDDAALLNLALKRGGYDVTCERVDTPEAMREALRRGGWDIVISDYVMPRFNGIEALRLMQSENIDLPFIVASGHIGEELAVDCMKAGAQDYVMKDKLVRLVPAVERELRDAEVRRARRASEQALSKSEARLQESLEAEKKARAEAEAAVRAKDRFLAMLSHELRTPLTPILMLAHTLQNSARLPPKVQSALKMIQRNVELEARLIDDLLDLSRITHQKMELQLQTVDVHSVVQAALEVCHPDIQARRQQITTKLKAARHITRADPARLQQVFWNLIKNAVKFTPPEGTILVQSANFDDKIRVRVKDSGRGIEKHMLDKIFRPFEQCGQKVTHEFGGLGLGLAISKAAIEAHGGRLMADSPGRDLGAEFTVELTTNCSP
ncbi:MAG: hybrid sensor histidine kinase/response regulator [Verrucomicrobia subdivision 3 bacterium]|nr:hybrid sensor histidine kinase/response regulator [Limisphaerales bacterium]